MNAKTTEAQTLLELSEILESVFISVHRIMSRCDDDDEHIAELLMKYFADRAYDELRRGRRLAHNLSTEKVGEEALEQHLENIYLFSN